MLSDADRAEAEGEGDADESDEEEDDGKDLLDMPPSWSPKLYIDKEKFLNLCPNGEKTVFYKKC